MNTQEKPSTSNLERIGPSTGAPDLVEQAKSTADHFVETARDQVSIQVAERKGQAADSIREVAHALRDANKTLRDKDPGLVPFYVDKAACQLDKLSGYLRRTDINDTMQDVARFARREPALFIGGAFAVGIVAGRFLRSSSSRDESRRGIQGAPMNRSPQRRAASMGSIEEVSPGPWATGPMGTATPAPNPPSAPRPSTPSGTPLTGTSGAPEPGTTAHPFAYRAQTSMGSGPSHEQGPPGRMGSERTNPTGSSGSFSQRTESGAPVIATHPTGKGTP